MCDMLEFGREKNDSVILQTFKEAWRYDSDEFNKSKQYKSWSFFFVVKNMLLDSAFLNYHSFAPMQFEQT